MKRIICISFFIFGFILTKGYSQNDEKVTPRLEFTYLKKANGDRLLKANLNVYKKKVTYPSKGSIITFVVGQDLKKYEIETNDEGFAYLIIDKSTTLKLNSEGIATFQAEFAGNDTLENVTEEILVKDAFISLSLETLDSVRTIVAHLSEISPEGDTIAVVGETLGFYVPRMINLLKIGEETTDEEGNISLEFPKDLPGNTDKTITVLARLEENEKFANVEVSKVAPWGIPIINRIPESHRALWTEIAPVWMIVTLTILLLGVWGHYIYVIVQLILVKREGKQQKA